ncbi:ABC transporter substrate-binding protein [Ramlibacter sp.]|uniref:ABC transporter substrate-binding protein n=1 Tax=Ramlibacter sp. TaxID=1917967 RepID=UPI003D1098F6
MIRSIPTPGAAVPRRRFLQAGAAGSALVLGGYAPALLAQSKAPLKIGVLNSFSKVFAALAAHNLNGMNLYFDGIGNTIAGRKIELIREDDEINPQVGLTKMKKLVESDRVDLVTGVQASNVALALIDYVRQSKTFFLCSGAGVGALSYVNVPTFFRCSFNGWQAHSALGTWMFQNVARECITLASDFAGGRDTVLEFKLGFQRAGGRIIKEIYPPLGTNDFSAYLADVRSAKPPATFSFFAGSDATRYVKQYAEYGLKGAMKSVASGFLVESDVLPAQGRDALGIVSALHYTDTLDNPENRKFVTDYRAKYKEYPSVYSEYGYVAARCIHHSLMAIDGNTQDKDRMRAAMLAMRFNAPRGPFRFNPATQNPIHNIYVREVAEVQGRIANKVIATIPEVREPDNKPT